LPKKSPTVAASSVVNVLLPLSAASSTRRPKPMFSADRRPAWASSSARASGSVSAEAAANRATGRR
jgi:hypothetical protein